MEDARAEINPNVLPPEIGRWNWGAFLLNWIWGVGNNTFIALLMFVPLVNVVMPFVLGARGDAWAWRNGRWDSVEHFRRVQRKWAIWGVIIWLVMIGLFAGILGGVFYALRHSEAYALAAAELKASSEVTEALGSPIATGFPTGSVSTNGANGHAALSFSVSGPKGTGQAFVAAQKRNGIWSLTRLTLKVEGRDDLIEVIRPTRDARRRGARFAVAHLLSSP